MGRQIARLEQRISDEGSAVKRQLEVLEFQNDQLKKRMEKYGTADKKQINYLNLMLNRALRGLPAVATREYRQGCCTPTP